MIKNDALFSYIAPWNIFAWLLMPLRYCMPMKQFVYLNRLVIKATHFPLLFCIYFYERYWLAPSMYEPTDLVENPGRGRGRTISLADPASRTAIFSPNIRVREESVVGYQKDRALEEVFRRVPDINALRNQRRNERWKTQNAIRTWMDQHGEPGVSPMKWPAVDPRPGRSDWQRRSSMQKDRPLRSRQVSDIRSAASDPADLLSNSGFPMTPFVRPQSRAAPEQAEFKDQTDADGDDELVTNDEDEEDNATNAAESRRVSGGLGDEDYFTTPLGTRFSSTVDTIPDSPSRPSAPASAGPSRKSLHSRTLSTNTILYSPQTARRLSSSSSISFEPSQPRSRPLSSRPTGEHTPTTQGQRSPRRSLYMAAAKSRPILTPREMAHTAPNRTSFYSADSRVSPAQLRRLSSIDTSVMTDNTNLLGADDATGAVPSSFQTQMAMAMMKEGRTGRGADTAESNRINKLVLSRMKTLEESFADVVKEMRELRTSNTAPTSRRNSSGDDLSRFRGMTMIEVAGRRRGGNLDAATPKRSSLKRPVSRRSMRETKLGTKDKGKGKEVAHSSSNEDEDDVAGGAFTKKGTSL
jgi:hypothetical protein